MSDKILVMNEVTWEIMQNRMIDNASAYLDPIDYIHRRYSDLDVDIDNSLPDNYVEVYETWIYKIIKKLEEG